MAREARGATRPEEPQTPQGMTPKGGRHHRETRPSVATGGRVDKGRIRNQRRREREGRGGMRRMLSGEVNGKGRKQNQREKRMRNEIWRSEKGQRAGRKR